MEVENKYITIKSHIEGKPQDSDFEFKSTSLSLTIVPGSNDIVVRNLYVSNDPYQINRMKSHSSSHKGADFSVGIIPGQEIYAFGVGKIVASANPEFEKDDLVVDMMSWADYTLMKGGGANNSLRKLDPLGFPLSYHVSIFAISGLTAYAGFFGIGKPKKEEKVFVSAASGSVENLVGQYAKLFGCYVVGCAGTNEKVNMLKEKLGFDEAFNYKEEPDLKSALKRYFPEGIDIYFDNVGAEMLEAAVANMNPFGRVAVCGAISEYTSTGKKAAPDMLDVIYKRIRMEGFLAADHFNLFPEFMSTTTDHVRTGKMHVIEDVSRGLESIPSAFIGLFRGDNVGKKIVQIGELNVGK